MIAGKFIVNSEFASGEFFGSDLHDFISGILLKRKTPSIEQGAETTFGLILDSYEAGG